MLAGRCNSKQRCNSILSLFLYLTLLLFNSYCFFLLSLSFYLSLSPVISSGLESNAPVERQVYYHQNTRELFLCHVYLTHSPNFSGSQSISLSPLLHRRHSWQLNTSSKSAATHICAIVKLSCGRLGKQGCLGPSTIKLWFLTEPGSLLSAGTTAQPPHMSAGTWKYTSTHVLAAPRS